MRSSRDGTLGKAGPHDGSIVTAHRAWFLRRKIISSPNKNNYSSQLLKHDLRQIKLLPDQGDDRLDDITSKVWIAWKVRSLTKARGRVYCFDQKEITVS